MRCGKIIYPNATVAHQYMLKEKKDGVKLSYYYCELCEGYHLTRMTPKAQEAFKKNVLNAHKLKKKKLEEIKVGPFGSMYEAWKDIDDFCKRERKNIEDLEKEMNR